MPGPHVEESWQAAEFYNNKVPQCIILVFVLCVGAGCAVMCQAAGSAELQHPPGGWVVMKKRLFVLSDRLQPAFLRSWWSFEEKMRTTSNGQSQSRICSLSGSRNM